MSKRLPILIPKGKKILLFDGVCNLCDGFVQFLLKRDKKAIDLAYTNYSKALYGVILRVVQSEEAAEEILQDVFVNVYKNAIKFKGNASLKTWIYRITINESINYLRYKQRKKRFGFHVPLLTSRDSDVFNISDIRHPGILLEDKEGVEYIMKAINGLPNNQKTAILLKTVDGLSQKEIAEVLETSVKAVEALLSRARKKLKIKLID